MARGLTDNAIKNLRAGDKRREIPDPGARGLYVIVEPSGFKSFAVRFRINGKTRKLSLGNIPLSKARKAAAHALDEVKEGRDPTEAKAKAKEDRRAIQGNTFGRVAEQYFKIECGLKLSDDGRPTFNGNKRTAARRLTDLNRLVLPTLGDKPISEIKRSEITELLDNIQNGDLRTDDGEHIKGGPVMADRTLALIRKIMNWHAARADDFVVPIVKGMTRTKPKERARSRTLIGGSPSAPDFRELRAVWKAAGEGEGPFPALIKFLLLTGARRSEAAEMRWDEVSDSGDWTLPAARNKTKLDLVRPLSEAAQGVLATQSRDGCPYIFTTDGKHPLSGFSKFKRDFDKQCGVTGWTLHDLRRTARTLLSRAGISSQHAEKCLGHVIKGVEGDYDKHEFYEEKKAAFVALATLIERIAAPAGNVTSLRKNKPA